MNKRKYLLSSSLMVLMLFLVTFRQVTKIMELNFLNETSITNDLSFIGVSFVLVVVISICTYYLPLLLVFETSIILDIRLSPIIRNSNVERSFNQILYIESRVYLRLNVIRCWFLVDSLWKNITKKGKNNEKSTNFDCIHFACN